MRQAVEFDPKEAPVDVRAGPLWLRVALIYLASTNALIGLWATLAPRSFFDDFPGGGRHWVAGDGPYNEHLVRDVGAWSLALAAVILAAAWTAARGLVIVAGIANVLAGLPHAVYHSRHSDLVGSAADKAVSIGGLWLATGLGLAVAARGWRLSRAT
jgi:hypothetical protein